MATPFKMESYADNLLRCQRYFYASTEMGRLNAPDGLTTDHSGACNFPVTMRADPTATVTAIEAGTGSSLGGIASSAVTKDVFFYVRTNNGGSSARRAVDIAGNVDAEL